MPDVHIIDDDAAVRESLAFLCESGGFTTAIYTSPLDFLERATRVERGCVLTDVRMPQMDGLTLIRTLHERGFRQPIVVMTGHGDVPMAVAAMKAGAVDFLEKPFQDTAMLAAIRAALDRPVETPAITSAQAEFQARLASLSERETQVLGGLLDGKANKVIAIDLGISPRTVEIYRAKVMLKMEARSLAELVRMVVTRGPSPD